MASQVVELTFSEYVPVHGCGERPIDRTLLLEIAPDREELIMENSIEAIRDKLVVNISELTSEHWLLKAAEQTRVRVRNTPRILRSWTQGIPTMLKVRMSDLLAKVGRGSDGGLFVNTGWANLRLSTQDIMISPRPLGPTHTLVIYSDVPGPTGIYPKVIEMPITGLILAAHCPNLQTSQRSDRIRFPHRLPTSLPKISLRVPHLESFSSLVVYMHTHNQAKLFRSLTPQWILDVIHPLPLAFIGLKSDNKGSGTIAFDDIAKNLAKFGTYDQLVEAASSLNGLRRNIEFVGLRVLELDAELELFFRVLMKAVFYKSQVDEDDDDGKELVSVQKVLQMTSSSYRFLALGSHNL